MMEPYANRKGTLKTGNKEYDDMKLEQIRSILLDAVEEMVIMVFNMERELVECVHSVEDVVSKRDICKTIIALGRLLRDFPKKSRFEKREFANMPSDPRVIDFLDKMDKAIFTVKSKFQVIKEFVENTNSLTNALTLALILRDSKKVMLREDLNDDEDSKVPKLFKPASISDVENEVSANKGEKPSDPTPTRQTSSPTPMDSPKADEDVVVSSAEAMEQKINEALKTKQGTLRIKRSQTESALQSPSKSSANYADAVQTLLTVQDDSLDLVLKDPAATKLFHAFLKKEFAEDNLIFYEECAKFKQMKTSDKIFKKKCEEMFNTYIKVGAPMEVNLPGALHRNIVDTYNKGDVTPNTFDMAQKSVFHLMENDSFRRFMKTEDYKNYVKGKGYQKIKTREQRKSSMSLVLNTLEGQSD